MTTYTIIDAQNLFHRAKHVVRGDVDTMVGMCLHISLNSILKTWRDFKSDHIVFCLEGRSWRKDVYPPYKANRKKMQMAKTEDQLENDQIFQEAFDDLISFIKEYTNCTVLQNSKLEADDLIAGWIKYHPEDHHIIVSSDTDFVQLIAPNVMQYNGVTNTIISNQGYFDENWKPIKDKKTGKPKNAPDPEWELFEKCIRGDSTDNIFSAYPGARKKGSKNKVGLIEAFENRKKQGFEWNNLMMQRWVDHNQEEHIVRIDYERNRMLIDLTNQPPEIQEIIDETIKNSLNKEKKKQVGIWFMKFCGKWSLNRISDQAELYSRILNTHYEDICQIKNT